MKMLLTLSLTSLLFKFACGANILGIFGSPSVSHQAVFQKIWKELSLRGHKVTVITPDPLKDSSLTNLTEIDTHFTYKEVDWSPIIGKIMTLVEKWRFYLLKHQYNVFEEYVKLPQVQELLTNTDRKYDIVLAETINPIPYAFSYKYNCPLIGILSMDPLIQNYWAVGSPTHPVLTPDVLLDIDVKPSFLERLWSTYNHVRMHLSYDYEIMPELDRVARKYFGDDMPYLGDIEKNVSIILTTHNFITSKPKPTVPALIEIGNVHLKKNVKLPQDLQKELDKATSGVIYFSLGSNVKSVNISSQLRNVIISTFAELPYTVLWKWESDHLPGKPDNVITRRWLPQEAVLAHPNVKVFITQGGLQSMEEGIYYRKPLVGMPFFADQMKNVRSITEHGIGVAVNIDSLTKEKFKSSILEAINNKKYREKISELADLIWDQPMSGLDTAVWWIEYVIRHKGAKHLRSPLLDLPLYQYLLLDVLAFVIGVIATILGLLYATYVYTKPVILGIIRKNKVKTN